jgi:ATP:corrinoid adenosyltransferase
MAGVRRARMIVNTGAGQTHEERLPLPRTGCGRGLRRQVRDEADGRRFVKIGDEKPGPADVRRVAQAWAEAETAIESGERHLVVFDEINYAISYGMLDPSKVVEG